MNKRHKKKPIVLFAILALFLIVFYMFYQEGSLPVDKENQGSEVFVVKKGQGLNSIVKDLSGRHLIRNKVVFFLVIKQMGLEKKIQAGEFRLSKSMTAQDVAQTLTHGTEDVWVTVIEGLRKEEIAQVLGQNMEIDEKEFIEKSREGYLFPDTYLIPKRTSVDNIISIFTANFNAKYTGTLKKQIESKGLTEREALIIASLLEKEAKLPEDKKRVAGILVKRYKEGWLMQLDATIQYALGYQKKTKTWWKKELTVDDIKVDSTYNTYKYRGLPPAPICNPGLESLEAVAEAQIDTPYWYYISDIKGNMHYGVTLGDHNANIKKYLRF
ncbi:MAG: endolytic transglycosylase MltG [Patescibacteria group bacterium]